MVKGGAAGEKREGAKNEELLKKRERIFLRKVCLGIIFRKGSLQEILYNSRRDSKTL